MVFVNKPFPSAAEITFGLLKSVSSKSKQQVLVDYITALYAVYAELNFTYLEINPLVVLEQADGITVHALDLAAKLDQTADFECGHLWSKGRQDAYPEIKSIGTIVIYAKVGQ
jgi:ATP citrate (pro-S)-lyase